MRGPGVLLAGLLIAGCGAPRTCKPGTLFVTATLEGATQTADTLHVDVTLDGARLGADVAHGGGARGTIAVAFPGSYPAGHRVDVHISALAHGAALGSGGATLTLAAGCATIAVDIRPAGAPGAMADLAVTTPPDLAVAADAGGAPGFDLAGAPGDLLAPNGTACHALSDCASGHCIDGVCCDQACDGQCQACDITPGTCSGVTTGQPHGLRLDCTGKGTACYGSCTSQSTAACSYPGASVSCRAQSCSGNTVTEAAGCDGDGACTALAQHACATSCSGDVCLSDCTKDGECSDAARPYCNQGQCLATKPLGRDCMKGTECSSGNCVDGYCCSSSCNGTCQACDIAGNEGTCATVISGQPHGTRGTCISGSGACQQGSCNGSSPTTCSFPDGATSCGSTCSGGVQTNDACDGKGSCAAAGTQPCGGYTCGGNACNSSCSDDGQCASGWFCFNKTCVQKLVNGQKCTGADQCGSGNCVDTYCCDAPCGGQCQACDVATGSGVGHCQTLTSGQPHGTRASCITGTATCQQGACAGATTCTMPTATTSCGGSCASGTQTSDVCDGSGNCVTGGTAACAPYICGTTACRTACNGDGECTAGYYCTATNGGTCQPVKANGAGCGGNDQCASGHCVDAVCCNVACAGTCQTCIAVNSVGTCKTVTGTTTPPRGACPGSGTCGASCSGNADCTYAGTSTQCNQICNNNTQTTYFCDGAGSCSHAVPQTCASGQVCYSGACCTRLTTCGSNKQCGSISDGCGGKVTCDPGCPISCPHCSADNLCDQC